MFPPGLAHRITVPNTVTEESTAIEATTEMIEAEAEVEAGETTVEIEHEKWIAIIAEIEMIEDHRTSEMSLAGSGGVASRTIGPVDQIHHKVELVHHHTQREKTEIHPRTSR